jgi:hypothetical protein
MFCAQCVADTIGERVVTDSVDITGQLALVFWTSKLHQVLLSVRKRIHPSAWSHVHCCNHSLCFHSTEGLEKKVFHAICHDSEFTCHWLISSGSRTAAVVASKKTNNNNNNTTTNFMGVGWLVFTYTQ